MESGPFNWWIDSSLDMETWSSRVADCIDVGGGTREIDKALFQKMRANVVAHIFVLRPLS